MIRLNKFMANAGIASRRRCDDFIMAGAVKVNGQVANQLGTVIDETRDAVTFRGNPIGVPDKYIYVLLNKPTGVVSTAIDEHLRRTVVELVTIPERIFPVGRLDFQTTGVLMLTNDGDLTHHLLHPNYKVQKLYRILLDKVIRPIDLHHLRNGVMLEEKMTQPCKITELRIVDNCSLLQVELREGRNRQLRKMFELYGYEVQQLERISFAGLTAGRLQPGEWRYLTGNEIVELKKRVGFGK
jgi:pseudouridine synthase